MRRFLPTYLISASFFIAELHTFWHNDSHVQNWIWQAYRPMAIRWNIYYAAGELNGILLGVSLYLLGFYPNRVNRTSALVYLCWAIFDCVTYFVNFKQDNYGAMYFYLAALWLLLFYGKRIARYIWSNLHPHEA